MFARKNSTIIRSVVVMLLVGYGETPNRLQKLVLPENNQSLCL